MRWPEVSGPAVSPGPPRPVLFVDRDGVLLVEKDYLADPAEVELVPGVPEALRRAREAGLTIVGLSNQSGLGRGRFTVAQFEAVMRRFDAILGREGVPLDAFFYCPHAPQDACRCRKPAPGLLEEAAAVLAWDPARAWLVGDKVSDVDLALAAGLRPVLVRTGHGRAQEALLGDRRGVLVAEDLPAALTVILGEGPP
jgi:histidinol-phosphate phosphatase family protein